MPEFDPWENPNHVPPLPNTPEWGQDDWSSPGVQEQQAIIEKSPRLHTRLVRRIGGIAAGVLLAGGVAAGAGHVMGGEGEAASHPSDEIAAAVAFDAFEKPTALDPIVASDIERAVSVDECSTKVTESEVTAFYSRLFSERTLPSTIEELTAQSDATQQRLKEAAEKVFLTPLSAEQQAFIDSEAAANYSGSYDTYKQVFSEYLGQLNIKLTDNWNNETVIGNSVKGEQLAAFARSMSQEELEGSAAARVQIVRSLESLSKMPRAVIQEAGLEEVVIGDMLSDKAVGGAPVGTDLLVLDAKSSYGQNIDEALVSYSPTIVSHEVAHLLDYKLCISFLGSFVDDPGYASLNRDFAYGQSKVDRLDNMQLVDGKYTTLLNGVAGEAVVSRGYGATNAAEDKGTMLGENVLYTPGTETLVSVDNAVIAQEKVSLLLARIAEKNPDIAEYYVQVLQAAKVADTAHELAQPLNDQLFTIFEELADSGVQNPAEDPKYIAAAEAVKPYEEAVEQLENLIANSAASE